MAAMPPQPNPATLVALPATHRFDNIEPSGALEKQYFVALTPQEYRTALLKWDVVRRTRIPVVKTELTNRLVVFYRDVPMGMSCKVLKDNRDDVARTALHAALNQADPHMEHIPERMEYAVLDDPYREVLGRPRVKDAAIRSHFHSRPSYNIKREKFIVFPRKVEK